MASSSLSPTVSSRRGAASVSLALLGLLLACSYSMYLLNIPGLIFEFYTGHGGYSRILATVILALNWKSLPFAWSIRLWHCMTLHLFVRAFHTHTPDKLFHPVITESHASLSDIDSRLHKSNSTYLADLDISRSHLMLHLLARAGHLAFRNSKTHLVMDPSNPSEPARGSFSIGIGAVHCAFKREVKPYQKYEMWSRIMTWDRKWLYIVTHFVEKGAVKPRSWDAQNCGQTRKTPGEHRDWEKRILATAITSHVFKIGRLTIHPAIMLEASGLLPEHPGGWTSDTSGDPVSANSSDSGAAPGHGDPTEWTWERTERERQRGLEYARHFAAMNDLSSFFDGGEDGALGRFCLG
ncbi:capsule polysaccharide biosynthesis protein [Xylaria venustula]|nr:capsule polysaccharide biosynthesis protein [Xylaria venustula]